MSPTPMATSGGSLRASRRMGAKKVAPPIPEAMAVVATTIPTGSMYQY